MSETVTANTETTTAAAATDKTTATATTETATSTTTQATTALTETGTGTEKTVTAPATWPEDWRTKLAGGDDKALKRFERYADPGAVAKAFMELEKKFSGTRTLPPIPATDASAEDVAAYRKATGVPDAADGYLAKLPDGLKIDGLDKGAVAAFAEAMHAKHASPDMVHAALASYNSIQQAAAADRAEKDHGAKVATEEELRADWGADYRRNMNTIVNWANAAMGDAGDLLLGARLADGTAVGNSPAILRGLLSNALEINPAATVVPGAGQSAGKGVDERITEIEGRMKTDRKAYFADPKVQAEYRQLLEVRDRMKARAA